MRQRYIFAFLGLVLASGYAFAGQAPTPVAPQGETRVVSTLGHWPVEVVLKTHEVQIGKPSDPRPDIINSSCTYSRYPCSVVDLINIKVNSNPIFVPRSVFCDLADLDTAEMGASGKGVVLTLTGGDASEAYVVKIWFDAEAVKRRILWSAIEPKQPLEETVYHMVSLGN